MTLNILAHKTFSIKALTSLCKEKQCSSLKTESIKYSSTIAKGKRKQPEANYKLEKKNKIIDFYEAFFRWSRARRSRAVKAFKKGEKVPLNFTFSCYAKAAF